MGEELTSQGQKVAAASSLPLDAPKRLADLLQAALTGHPSVAGKQRELEAAQLGVSSAKWLYGPSATATANFCCGGVEQFEVKQPLWSGGRIEASVQRAGSETDLAYWGKEEARTALAERVITTYSEWLRGYERVRGIAIAIQEHARLHQRIVRRAEEGVSSNAEVTLSISRLSQANSERAMAEAARDSALARLSQLVGVTLRNEQLVQEQYVGENFELFGLLADARNNNPSISRSKAQVDVAASEIARRKSLLMPDVSLVWRRTAGDYTGLNVPAQENWMVRLDLAPGAGLSSLVGVDAAVAGHTAALYDLESVQRDVDAQVGSTFEQYRATRSSLLSTEATFGTAGEIVAAYERQFLAGKRGWQEVMNAARELDSARRALFVVRVDLFELERKLKLYAGGVKQLDMQGGR